MEHGDSLNVVGEMLRESRVIDGEIMHRIIHWNAPVQL